MAFRRPRGFVAAEMKPGDNRVLGEHRNFLTARFSPDGRLAVSSGGGELTLDTNEWVAGDDFDVRIWDVKSGKELHRLKHAAASFAVFAPDGRHLLTASGKSLRLWDPAGGKELAKHDYDFGVSWAVWSPDGKRWFVGCGDRNVRQIDAANGKEIRAYAGHTDGHIESVAFSPDGKHILSGSIDGTMRLWETGSGKELHRFEGVHLKGRHRVVVHVVFSPDGNYALSSGWDKTVRLWRLPR